MRQRILLSVVAVVTIAAAVGLVAVGECSFAVQEAGSTLVSVTKRTKHVKSSSDTSFTDSVPLGPGSLEGKEFCFVHVGKTAGAKISCELGYDYTKNCPAAAAAAAAGPNTLDTKQQQQQPGSLLAAHATGAWTHLTHESCPDDLSVFLITLRNPVERIISWFHYERKMLTHYYYYWSKMQQKQQQQQPRQQQVLYQGMQCLEQLHRLQTTGCFVTVNQFAESCQWPGTDNQNHHTPTNDTATILIEKHCQRLAWNASRGDIACLHHNEYNYAMYKKIMDRWKQRRRQLGNPQPILLGIRTEHLAQDWDDLEVLYGGNNVLGSTGALIFNSTVNAGKKSGRQLSPIGLRNLCRALCQEIQIYKQLLQEAVNFSPRHREQSMKELQTYCPSEAEQQICQET